MSLSTITRRGPEISDAIVSFDPITLQRKPVKKADASGAITIALTVLIVTLMLRLGGALSWLRSRELIA